MLLDIMFVGTDDVSSLTLSYVNFCLVSLELLHEKSKIDKNKINIVLIGIDFFPNLLQKI